MKEQELREAIAEQKAILGVMERDPSHYSEANKKPHKEMLAQLESQFKALQQKEELTKSNKDWLQKQKDRKAKLSPENIRHELALEKLKEMEKAHGVSEGHYTRPDVVGENINRMLHHSVLWNRKEEIEKQIPKELKRRRKAFEAEDLENRFKQPHKLLISPDANITEGFGPYSRYDLQAQKAFLEGIVNESNQDYVKNPHLERISLKHEKEALARKLGKLEPNIEDPNSEFNFFKKEAKDLYSTPSKFNDYASNIGKALKTKSILKNADKMMGGFKHRLDEINEKYADHASDSLAKLLTPFQNGQMKQHGQTGNLVANLLSNVAKHREKEKNLLLERMSEKALSAAQQQSHAKAQHKQSLLSQWANEQRNKSLNLANVYDYSRRYNKDFEEDLNRTMRHQERAAHEHQEDKNLKANEWERALNHRKHNLRSAVEMYKGVPSKEHEIPLPKRPDPLPNDAQTLGAGLMGMAGGLSKTHKEKTGGRIQRAEGGALVQEAIENAQKNHLDPIKSLRNVSYYDQIKALEQKINDRQKQKKGDAVSSENPINEGSRLAKEYALQDKVLAHADHLEQPRELNPLTAALDGLAAGLSEHPGFGMASKAWTKGREGVKAHEKAEEDRSLKAADIRHKVSKEMKEERKDKRHLDIEEQKAKAIEAHYKATEAQAERHHHESLSKQDLAERRFLALHGKPGIDRPLNKEEKKSMREAVLLRQKAQKFLKHTAEMKEILSKIEPGGFLAKATHLIPGKAGDTAQEWLTGDQEKAERFRALANEFVIDKHGELKNIPRTQSFMTQLAQTKPDLYLSKENNLKGIQDLESIAHNLNALADEIESEHGIQQGEEMPSEEMDIASSPAEEDRASKMEELQALYAKAENRKKLGDIVKRYRPHHQEGDSVQSPEIFKMMMQIPETRNLIHGLYGV